MPAGGSEAAEEEPGQAEAAEQDLAQPVGEDPRLVRGAQAAGNLYCRNVMLIAY